MKTRKKEKQIIEKILNKVMESGILLNGNGHFAVYEAKGKIISIAINNGLFSSNSEIGRVELYVTPNVYWDAEDNEKLIDFKMRLYKKVGSCYWTLYLQKDKSEVLRKFLDYIDDNKHQILQCDYEHGCSLFVTDVNFN